MNRSLIAGAATTTNTTRDLAATAASVGTARNRVAEVLSEWNLAVHVENASLIVSELATNATEASDPTEVIKLHLAQRSGEVVLAVWDSSRLQPARKRPFLTLETLDLAEENFDANGGWGLSIVETLASRYWVEPTTPTGKWVCAALPTTP
ncbi:ATP-binding protein [Spirillospora sp. CA-294931]|uniref:ATP-binding protein n=1 Tax=Spirillospora sp. CA-294931 TaxID=3240042 RepID=UPI003D8B738F